MSDAVADLVIIGSGPAGMAAACEARALNLSVVLLDEQATIGGQIYRSIESAPAERLHVLGQDYASGRSLASDFRNSGTRYVAGAVVWNVSSDGTVDYVSNGRSEKVIGKHVLLASGAMERLSRYRLDPARGHGSRRGANPPERFRSHADRSSRPRGLRPVAVSVGLAVSARGCDDPGVGRYHHDVRLPARRPPFGRSAEGLAGPGQGYQAACSPTPSRRPGLFRMQRAFDRG